MGLARLLAKGWVAFCVFAGAHALVVALNSGLAPALALRGVLVCVALFGAMGLLFLGGYSASASHSGMAAFAGLRPARLVPGFDEIVFVVFAAGIFIMQTVYAAANPSSPAANALEGAIAFVVPGQHVVEVAVASCSLDSGIMLSSAFAWLVAFVFLGSALSRIRLAAALVRLERKGQPEILGAAALVFVLGFAAVVGIQMLFIGTGYLLLSCGALGGIPGAVVIGLGPLMLAYLITAALTDLLALGPEA